MSQQIQFLKEQSECLKYIFEHIKVIDLQIKQVKKDVKQNTLSLNPRYYILQIENQLTKLSILIKEFNKSEFFNIKKEQVDERYYDLIYSSQRKIQKEKSV